jgi:hypothetical protein
MKAKVAVATVSGRAYFLLVTELRERNIDFVSIVPGDPVPPEAKVLITTEKEQRLINHERILLYDPKTDPAVVVNEAVKILQGKESYEKIVVGIDPGEVFGLAVIADGKVNETSNCLSIREVLNVIKSIIKGVDVASTAVSIRIGNGVPVYKDLLATLDSEMPPRVVLEVVNEGGTDRLLNRDKHRRGLRDIASAIRIAGRVGYAYPRGKTDEADG